MGTGGQEPVFLLCFTRSRFGRVRCASLLLDAVFQNEQNILHLGELANQAGDIGHYARHNTRGEDLILEETVILKAQVLRNAPDLALREI